MINYNIFFLSRKYSYSILMKLDYSEMKKTSIISIDSIATTVGAQRIKKLKDLLLLNVTQVVFLVQQPL